VAKAGWLVLSVLVLSACGSGQSLGGPQLAIQTRTVTAPPSTVIVHQPVPSIASSTKVKVPATRTSPRTVVSTPPTSKAVKPKLATAPKPTAAAGLCGAPANPFGYTFCGGQVITAPDPAVCNYFNCIPYFPKGKGYMEQCRDGMYSMSGGRSGACSSHGGENQPVLTP
jgi:hypothetical protein